MTVQQFRNFAVLELFQEIEVEEIVMVFLDQILLFEYPKCQDMAELKISFIDFCHFIYSGLNDVQNPERLKFHQVTVFDLACR
jgi:hypothetical protein